jgi:hypothetical protein
VRLVGDAQWWPTAHPAAFRNRLLDEGGGDSRPHVELAWRLHELGVAARLASADGAPLVRCRTVARDLAAEALLDREATRWGVESWALALGVVDAATFEAARAAERADLAARRAAPPASPEATGAARMAAPPGRAGAPSPTAPPRSGGTPPLAGPPPKRRWTIGTPGTPKSPLPRGPSPRAVVGTVALILGLFAAAIGGARLIRPAQVAPVAPVTPPAPAPAPSSTAPAATAPPSPSPVAEPPNVPRGMRGEVRLRDGRRLVGEIDLVTASDVFLHDTTSGLPMAMPLAFVAEVRTADGRVAWRAAAGDAQVTTAPPPVALRARGIGGIYRVTVQGASVDGDPACREAWQGAASVLTESIAHVPGADTATLASRPGVTLRLEPDGRFVAGPATGVDGSTRWRFAMRGRFAPEGFTASSDLRTETTLRWRKVRQCWVRADLAGVRRR